MMSNVDSEKVEGVFTKGKCLVKIKELFITFMDLEKGE